MTIAHFKVKAITDLCVDGEPFALVSWYSKEDSWEKISTLIAFEFNGPLWTDARKNVGLRQKAQALMDCNEDARNYLLLSLFVQDNAYDQEIVANAISRKRKSNFVNPESKRFKIDKACCTLL